MSVISLCISFCSHNRLFPFTHIALKRLSPPYSPPLLLLCYARLYIDILHSDLNLCKALTRERVKRGRESVKREKEGERESERDNKEGEIE